MGRRREKKGGEEIGENEGRLERESKIEESSEGFQAWETD